MEQSTFILVVVTAVFGGITLASLITLVIIRCSGACNRCFERLFPDEEKEDGLIEGKMTYAPVYAPSHNIRSKPLLPRYPSFEIPDKYIKSPSPIQPLLSFKADSFDSLASLESDEIESPRQTDTRWKEGSQLVKAKGSQDSEDCREVEPGLYSGGRRKTMGWGDLGKIRFSLRYIDKARRKLELVLHRLDKLVFLRKDIAQVFLNITLLPDREVSQKSKFHLTAVSPVYEESFIFALSLDDFGFELKAIRFVVDCIDKLGKEHHYGEARMPLLSREIYNQIETDVSLNIKPLPSQEEIGDVLLQLSYSFEEDNLSMTIKTVKFINEISKENYIDINFKCMVKRNRDIIGKKTSFHCLPVTKGMLRQVDVNHNDLFEVPKELFMQSTLKLTVTLKHKSLKSSSTIIGKVAVGHKSRDECGCIHWRTLMTSPELTWSVWHPIYAS